MAAKQAPKKYVRPNNPPRRAPEPLVGAAVMYHGLPGAPFVCPACARTIRKGIVFNVPSGNYCTRTCAAAN